MSEPRSEAIVQVVHAPPATSHEATLQTRPEVRIGAHARYPPAYLTSAASARDDRSPVHAMFSGPRNPIRGTGIVFQGADQTNCQASDATVIRARRVISRLWIGSE